MRFADDFKKLFCSNRAFQGYRNYRHILPCILFPFLLHYVLCHKSVLNKKRSINSYTEDGRAEIHKKLSNIDIEVDSVTLLGGLNEQTIPIIFESILLTYAGNHMIKEDFS